jgi:hypothetical protein
MDYGWQEKRGQEKLPGEEVLPRPTWARRSGGLVPSRLAGQRTANQTVYGTILVGVSKFSDGN